MIWHCGFAKFPLVRRCESVNRSTFPAKGNFMRKFARRNSTLLALSLALLAGCDTTESKDNATTPPTANNTTPQNTLTSAHSVTATIPGAAGSIDTFVVTLPVDSGRIYAVTIDNPVTNKLNAKLVASNGSQVTFAMSTIDNLASAKGVRDSLAFVTTKSDTLRFLIYGAGGTSILAKVASEPANGAIIKTYLADEYEFDDFDYRAGWITTDSTVQQRSLHTIYDVDWLRFLVVKGRTYKIHVRSDENLDKIEIDQVGTNFGPWWHEEEGYGADKFYYYSLTYEATQTDTAKFQIWAYTKAHYTITVQDTAGVGGDQIVDSYEDDDTISKAKLLPADGNWQQRTIDPDDIKQSVSDWVQFPCDSTRTYTLQSISFNGLGVTAYSPDSVWLPITFSETFEDWHLVQRAEFSSPHSGTCYMELGANSSRSYKVALTSRAGVADSIPVDVFEPDNVPSRAKYLLSDSTVQRRTFHMTEYSYNNPPETKDVDWVRLNVDSGKTYSIYPTGATYVAMYDGDTTRRLDLRETFSSSSSRVLVYPAAKNTTLLLKVTSSKASPQAYTIATVAHDGLASAYVPDAYESDDDFKSAKTLPSDGSWQSHSIHLTPVGANNLDFLSFDADSGRTYTLKVVSWTSLNVFVLRADSSLPLLEGIIGDTLETLTLPVTHTGKYFVSVNSRNSSTRATYRISLQSEAGLPSYAIPEPGETDTGWGNAIVLAAGAPTLGRFLAGDDTDWVRVPRKAGYSYTISVFDSASYSTGSDLKVVVRQANDWLLSSDVISARNEWHGTYAATKDDTLLVRISLYLSGRSKRLPYSIRVEETPGTGAAAHVALSVQEAKLEELP
jgi:hypothetical protein